MQRVLIVACLLASTSSVVGCYDETNCGRVSQKLALDVWSNEGEVTCATDPDDRITDCTLLVDQPSPSEGTHRTRAAQQDPPLSGRVHFMLMNPTIINVQVSTIRLDDPADPRLDITNVRHVDELEVGPIDVDPSTVTTEAPLSVFSDRVIEDKAASAYTTVDLRVAFAGDDDDGATIVIGSDGANVSGASGEYGEFVEIPVVVRPRPRE